MNNESRNLIYSVINELRLDLTKHMGNKTKEWASKLETALRDMDKYNGWPTYETWNMHLILSNNQELDNKINSFLHQELNEYNTEDKPFSSLTNQAKRDVLYEIADSLKEYIENTYYYNCLPTNITIYVIDYEAWTYRDFQEINWYAIVKAFLEDYLREIGFKED
ncbi:MAG: hypothetical protein WC365_09290 [Candidatus Babeliales bacterium]|jgi:hypothetical protein